MRAWTGFLRTALALGLLAAAAGCATVDGAQASPKRRVEYGLASFYGVEFEGRLTASGERYDPRKLTAAHRTLPFGSHARVTNLTNHRSVTVRINDRGPHREGRIIDLSRRAARDQGFVGAGITQVRVQPLRR